MVEDIAYIPISQELIITIEKLKEKHESVQDFIKRLIEEFAFQQDIELAQLEKMTELWKNEEDNIWDNMS
ncbi:hypothetical protein SAMN04488516_10213 [Desulfonauticus submarinus]|uniref:Uncharacterized protein n=1 Tax=Desulfonauticus submarinus TaxID=206665 RepID=A0A1H0B2R3_9BACT|nr:hypothetical protein [Desulfonauticus submarinus]SDN39951.1 hypothetical protein SAMN04488516_10213 [Desulfonauticus submarinus]